MWVLAIERYSDVYHTVMPKRIRLKEANVSLIYEKLTPTNFFLQENLATAKRLLAEKQENLAKVEAQLIILKTQYDDRMQERRELSRRVEETSTRIARAHKLMSGLADEQVKKKQ